MPPIRGRTQISLLNSKRRLFPLRDIKGPHTKVSVVLVRAGQANRAAIKDKGSKTARAAGEERKVTVKSEGRI